MTFGRVSETRRDQTQTVRPSIWEDAREWPTLSKAQALVEIAQATTTPECPRSPQEVATELLEAAIRMRAEDLRR